MVKKFWKPTCAPAGRSAAVADNTGNEEQALTAAHLFWCCYAIDAQEGSLPQKPARQDEGKRYAREHRRVRRIRPAVAGGFLDHRAADRSRPRSVQPLPSPRRTCPHP